MFNNKHLKYGKLKISCLLILAIIIVGAALVLTAPKSKVVSPLADEQPKFSFLYLFQKEKQPKKITDLSEKIKPLIENKSGLYSVYVYDLITKNSYGINENMILTAASVNKIPILATLYYLSLNQTIDLDERITVQRKDIQDYGTGIIRNQGPGGIYSLKTLAQLMMAKSDNTAAYILTNKIGVEKIQSQINQWGLTQTDMVNNKSSNKDLAMLLIKMYQGQITNQALTLEMMGMMLDSDFENRLPKYLPENIKIYHKIGTEIGNIHDVGIIEIPQHPYFLGVLTNDVSDETATEENIAQISKIVYEFMIN